MVQEMRYSIAEIVSACSEMRTMDKLKTDFLQSCPFLDSGGTAAEHHSRENGEYDLTRVEVPIPRNEREIYMLQTLDRGLAIMKYLAINNSASVSEIANVFAIPKSTASRIVSTLAHHDMACQRDSDKRYKLGVGVMMFGSQMLNENRLLEEYRPLMRQVMEITGEMVHLAGWYGKRVYTLDSLRGKEHASMRNIAMPGMPVSMHSASVGKLMLAFAPDDIREEMLASIEYPSYTSNTITDPEVLRKELYNIREQGYAVEREEIHQRVFSVAIPVFDHHGQVRFALALTSGRNILTPQEKIDYYLRVMEQCADKMKRKINSGSSI